MSCYSLFSNVLIRAIAFDYDYALRVIYRAYSLLSYLHRRARSLNTNQSLDDRSIKAINVVIRTNFITGPPVVVIWCKQCVNRL